MYYTLDGTYPTLDSSLYSGREIEITADLNHLQAILVDDNGYVATYIEQYFDFVSNFETDHINYGDDVHEYWLLQFKNLTTFNIYFDTGFRLSDTGDYLKIHIGDIINEYTGSALADTTIYLIDYGLMLEFETDSLNNNFYGFNAGLEVVSTVEEIEYYLNGDNVIYVEVDDSFVDDGITVIGYGSDTAYVEKDSIIDETLTGEYLVTYYVYSNQNRLLGSITRTVVIQDTINPYVSLNPSIDSLDT